MATITRRYVTQAEAERLCRSVMAIYVPSEPQPAAPGSFGHGWGADYYIVPDDDPRAGTEEDVHAEPS